ncbi:MAG: flagellar hook-length control protein FliK [Proteobacteria bacterium]|nr:flagellar hook-length control protein FliK [Pseudomonadota bacterium]
MKIPDLFKGRSGPQPAGDEGRLILVKDGLLKARVLEAPPSGPVSLKIGTHQVQAYVDRPLQTGHEVRLRVAETSPRLVMQVVDEEAAPTGKAGETTQAEPSARAQALAAFFQGPRRLAEIVAILRQSVPADGAWPDPVAARLDTLALLADQMAPRPDTADAAFLGRLVRLLGLNGRNVPLQEASARLLAEMITNPRMQTLDDLARWRALAETAVRLFEASDQMRAVNQTQDRPDQDLYLAFPLPWTGPDDRGELTFKRPPDSGTDGSDRAYRLTFLLSLSRIGKVKIDLSLDRGRIQGAIWTETQTGRQAVTRTLPRLVAGLEAQGFQSPELAARVFPDDTPPPESLAAELLARETLYGADRLVDVKV